MPSRGKVGDVEAYTGGSGCVNDLNYSLDGLSAVTAHLYVTSSTGSSPVRTVYPVIFFQDSHAFIHLVLRSFRGILPAFPGV